jgi:hypothetical protein
MARSSSARSSAEKIGVLPGWTPIARISLSHQPAGGLDHVEMAVGDGVERPGIEGSVAHKPER